MKIKRSKEQKGKVEGGYLKQIKNFTICGKEKNKQSMQIFPRELKGNRKILDKRILAQSMREASCMIERLEVGFQQVLQGTMLFTYPSTNLLLSTNNLEFSHILQFSMQLASDFTYVAREILIRVRLILPYTLKRMTQFCPVRYKGKIMRKLLRKKKMFAPKKKSQEKIK